MSNEETRVTIYVEWSGTTSLMTSTMEDEDDGLITIQTVIELLDDCYIRARAALRAPFEKAEDV